MIDLVRVFDVSVPAVSCRHQMEMGRVAEKLVKLTNRLPAVFAAGTLMTSQVKPLVTLTGSLQPRPETR
jgi:hypothetical protein